MQTASRLSASGLSDFCQMTDALIAQHAPRLVLLGHELAGVYYRPWVQGSKVLGVFSTRLRSPDTWQTSHHY